MTKFSSSKYQQEKRSSIGDKNEQSIAVDHSRQSTKRKRDQSQLSLVSESAKSLSQLSLSRQKPTESTMTKKKKKSDHIVNASSDNEHRQTKDKIFTFNKSSKYLKMPKKLLLHSLRQQLNHPIKIKKEQSFVLARLQLLDHQFCLDQVRYLYQSFFDQGRRVQMWPVSIRQSDRIFV